jgi:hypothetical protein
MPDALFDLDAALKRLIPKAIAASSRAPAQSRSGGPRLRHCVGMAC